MPACNRVHTFDMGDGYELCFFNQQFMPPAPQSRSFELANDTEHYAPDRPADVQHVKLVITLDFAEETVSGTAYTTFSALYEEVRTITFDAVELHVEEVSLADGPRLDYTTTDNKLIVTLDRIYHHGEQFTITIKYSAKPRTGMHFMKPVPEDPTRFVHAWSFGQPRYHSYWFPCHDEPNDRATTEMIVTVPADLLTISNGKLLSVTDHGATKTHHWRMDSPHATYLMSLVVGDFAVFEDRYNGKPVTYYVRKDRAHDARRYMGRTPEMMRFFSDYTGVEYPYETYDQSVVEIYAGAMEHTTATTHSFMLLMDERAELDLGPEYVAVVAHELAHQWFGDLVTCRDWPNGWLNEGFATYFEELWKQHAHGDDYFKWSMLNVQRSYLSEDARYRRPIVYNVYHDKGFELFDRHMYAKGGWVVHMLRSQLGDTTFRRAVKAYLERYREKEVITADLERTFEEVTGRSLAHFFKQWVYSGGYPAFEVQYTWDNEQRMAKIKIKQTQKVDELTPCFVLPVELAFTVPTPDESAQDEDTTETRTVPFRVVVGEEGQSEQNFYVPLEREPIMVRFDPEGKVLKTLKFPRSERMLRYQLKYDNDVLGRVEAAETLGEKRTDESIDALTQALYNDTFWGVRITAANALGKVGNEKAQNVLLQALQDLDPRQFARVRAAIVGALGSYQAPQQTELAERSAQALRTLLEKGDASYAVESAAASALGKTRTGNVAFLTQLLDRPSWNNVVQRGIFSGLAHTGGEEVIPLLTSYLTNAHNHPTLRRAAAVGFMDLGRNSFLYSEEMRQRAVSVLSEALAHDSWDLVRGACAMALAELGDKAPIALLERLSRSELNSGVQRHMRLAAHTLRSANKSDEQLQQLRKDLDEVREENRKLKEQLSNLEARFH